VSTQNFEEGRVVPSVRLLLLLPLVLAAVLLPGAAHSAATATALNVVVGPGFNIKVTDANGNNVTQLDPGAYSITVKNLSPQQEHNFHLIGPGINQASAFNNTPVTWNVTLADGTYKYQCDAHPTIMKGSFHVGALPPPAPPAPKLNGRVGPGKTISLKTSSGVVVKKLKAGTYKLTVKDSSKTDNFHLLGPGVNKKTGVKFRGTVSWKAKFQIGRKYIVRSDAHKSMRRTFTATTPPLPS
jgi:plastocyanin